MQNGHQIIVTECSDCSGYGEKIINKCETCNGEGHYKKEAQETIEIKKGIKHGEKIVLHKKGNKYTDKDYGDFVLQCFIAKDNFYQMDRNYNVFVEMAIPMHLVICGGKFKVPTLHGLKTITIKKQTMQGQKIKLKNCGYPIREGQYTDQFLIPTYEIPDNLSEDILDKIKEIPIDEKTYKRYSKTIAHFEELENE
jgi:molecular chaperone DnaJ